MPIANITNPGGAFGLPLTSASGVNDQGALLEVVNNSGTWLRHGDVVVWDTNTALSTVTSVTVSGAQSGTVTSFTLTAGSSTASYASSGALIIPTTITGSANPVPIFYSYTGISGSTFTGVKAHIASVTNGIASGATIYQWPQAISGIGGISGSYAQSVVSLAAAPADGGRYVTLSSTGAVKDPNVAGVVSIGGNAATTVGSPPQVNFPNAAIPPGGTCFIATTGVARVQINGVTVTAGDLECTGVAPGGASSGTPTLGNLIGVALEASTAKDANNTIRVALKIG